MTAPPLREALGIPAEARRVLLFAESSHWDTNWLSTSEEYFTDRVAPILNAVLSALERCATRVYCIESLFFLKLYWERRPLARDRVRRLFERRQLRLLASSFTTPDTLLPHPETILRDYQLGHAWLREQGLPDAPGTAYFPDNFGHSPHLPSLMRSVGVHSVGITRIDGMYFVGADWRRRGHFPRPDSTAALLEQVHRSHDFIWRDDDGAELLCHWNAHTYFLGDMLAHKGIIRWAGKTFALPWRSERHIASRIDGYVAQLEPFARTPYLLCPVGMDFNDPIEELPELLERYNHRHLAKTGTYALLAGLDDYLALVNGHRDALPVLEADPNPVWMGFLASRPEVKQRASRIARTLITAEKLSSTSVRDAELERSLEESWNTLLLSNHHDYIPGTSPDRVWHGEQRPWLALAEAAADRALTLAHEGGASAPKVPPVGAVGIDARGQTIVVTTPLYRLEFSRVDGGCLTSFVDAQGELLEGFGFDLVSFHDEGGLWRIGHEYSGGRFDEVERASQRPAAIEFRRRPGEVELVIRSELGGEPFERRLSCHADEPFLRLRVSGAVRPRRTVTCRFETALDPKVLAMDTVGGVIERPRERQYSPTYWAVPSRVTLDDGRVMHALFESPTAVALSPTGALEWIVARNATKERAFGWLPVLAHPIGGSTPEEQTHEAAVMGLGDVVEARRRLQLGWLSADHRGASHAAQELWRCDTPGVTVVAAKRSHQGDGVTVRLACDEPPLKPVHLRIHGARIARAFLCDALERRQGPLAVDHGGQVVVPLRSRLTSLWLELEATAPPALETVSAR